MRLGTAWYRVGSEWSGDAIPVEFQLAATPPPRFTLLNNTYSPVCCTLAMHVCCFFVPICCFITLSAALYAAL